MGLDAHSHLRCSTRICKRFIAHLEKQYAPGGQKAASPEPENHPGQAQAAVEASDSGSAVAHRHAGHPLDGGSAAHVHTAGRQGHGRRPLPRRYTLRRPSHKPLVKGSNTCQIQLQVKGRADQQRPPPALKKRLAARRGDARGLGLRPSSVACASLARIPATGVSGIEYDT